MVIQWLLDGLGWGSRHVRCGDGRARGLQVHARSAGRGRAAILPHRSAWAPPLGWRRDQGNRYKQNSCGTTSHVKHNRVARASHAAGWFKTHSGGVALLTT